MRGLSERVTLGSYGRENNGECKAGRAGGDAKAGIN